MADKLPDNKGTDEKKLQELESELQQLEQRAQKELKNQDTKQTGGQATGQQTPPQNKQTAPQQQQPAASNQNEQTSPPPTNQAPPPPPQGSGEGGGSRKIMWISLAVLAIALVGVGGFFLGQRVSQPAKTPLPTPVVTATPTPEPTANWETYTSSELGFRIKQPSEVEVQFDEANQTVSFMQFGPTQREGTEFYDGISLSFRSGSLEGSTLMEFVESAAQEIRDSGVSEVTMEPTPTTVAGLQGYTMQVRGLGEFTYYYLPVGTDRYLEIVDATQDPESQGFEETVEMMLSTLEVQVVTIQESPTPTASPSAGM